MNYADLLSTTEWKKFRDNIVKRDNWNCQKCGEKSNQIAWELKGSVPGEVYVRPATESERKELKQDIIYSSKGIILNAHHKYYIKNKNPWEYNPDALITVCSSCHTKIHETENIKIYENENFENPKIAKKCAKCRGTGFLDQYHYYMSGICFDCNGKGIIE
ncbi:hypothetical protein [Corallibacter sp.]|uniref:hypothetical protein n=1 Tax=Corallibacter sp. TaxID=2038084 RepID=UPI003AB8ABBF